MKLTKGQINALRTIAAHTITPCNMHGIHHKTLVVLVEKRLAVRKELYGYTQDYELTDEGRKALEEVRK